jgi:hypothetical protein
MATSETLSLSSFLEAQGLIVRHPDAAMSSLSGFSLRLTATVCASWLHQLCNAGDVCAALSVRRKRVPRWARTVRHATGPYRKAPGDVAAMPLGHGVPCFAHGRAERRSMAHNLLLPFRQKPTRSRQSP